MLCTNGEAENGGQLSAAEKLGRWPGEGCQISLSSQPFKPLQNPSLKWSDLPPQKSHIIIFYYFLLRLSFTGGDLKK